MVGAYPSQSHPTSAGRICVRGWHVHEVASSPDRLKSPLLKKNGRFQEITWDEALGFIATRLKEIRAEHGPDALAFMNSPRCSNEETYLLQKLARAVIGTNNVDHGSGVYSNNSINVLLDMIGVAATTNSVSELARSEVIVVDGVDLATQLPTIGGRVIRSKLGGAKLIIVDARRHRIAEQADFFLQLRPGTRVLLYGAMAKVIVDRGLRDLSFIRAHCRDYHAFLDKVKDFDLLQAADICGVSPELIEQAAVVYASAKSAAILYSTGIEARGASSVRSMINLALLTGHIGKEGSGIYALTEHNNLQGVCDMGMMPDRLPGYQSVTDTAARSALERTWQTKLPATPGASARKVWENRNNGKVRGVWLCRYDPVTTASFCDVPAVLKEMDLVVVQHLFTTASAQYAHVILPLVAFGEEQITFTSTERRIQLAEKVIEPPEGPMPAWQQFIRVARALGANWDYASAAEVMDEIGQVVPFYSGASYDNLARDYGRQWPCTKDKPLGTRFLFEEIFLDPLPPNVPPLAHSGRKGEEGFGGERVRKSLGKPFKFVPVSRPNIPRYAPEEFPMAMIFGHALYYWHQNVLVQHSETLKRELRVLLLDYPEGFVEINDDDARGFGIRDGDKIRVRGSSGTAVTTARVTREVRSGTIFVPFFVHAVEKQLLGAALPEMGNLGKPVFVKVEKA